MPDYVEAKYVKCKNYRVSKKTGISVQGSFNALKWPKIKNARKQTPPKIKFYLLWYLLSALYTTHIHPVYTMYTVLVSGIYCKYLLGILILHGIKY